LQSIIDGVPDESEPRFVDENLGRSGDASDDVLDHRPTPVIDLLQQRRVLVGVLVVTLAAGLGLGFLAGRRGAGSGTAATQTVVHEVTAPPPAPSSGPFDQLIGLARCSVQKGHQLQLGLDVRNELDAPVVLTNVRVPYTTGDQLRPVSTARGACGQLPGSDTGIANFQLAVGASVWLTVTVDVLTDCPTPLHLTFLLSYTRAGQRATTTLDGFSDLDGVPYTGCR
jgi:hypothetical protein